MTTETVFITGTTGFIGLHILIRLLPHYRVVAAIRTAAGEQRVRSALSRAGVKSTECLSFVVVPDIIKPTAYNEALSQSQPKYIIHVASPLVQDSNDLKASVVDPAVQGTLNMLNAALTTPSVTRIVITSSIVTQIDLITLPQHTDVVYSEATRATTVLYDKAQGGNAVTAYLGSKILAQKATREWLLENTERSFDVVTLHPSFVQGVNWVQESYASPAPGTNDIIWGIVAPGRDSVDPASESTVSVDDVADAHIKGLTVEVIDKNAPEEFMLSSPGVKWDDVESFVKQDFKEDAGLLSFKKKLGFVTKVDTKKAETVLGIKFKPFREQIKDVVGQQLAFYKQK